jgi:hypothetical protein
LRKEEFQPHTHQAQLHDHPAKGSEKLADQLQLQLEKDEYRKDEQQEGKN